MAHLEHFKQKDIKRLSNEYERDEKYECRDGRIDTERTQFNYEIPKPMRLRCQIEWEVERRVSKVPHSTRKDLNVMSTWIVTCPPELKEDREKMERFFQITHDFCRKRYGDDNVMTGCVHMDETSPHIHIPVVPVIDGRISAKALFTRKELNGFHKDLEEEMFKEFGIKGLILNGRTKGNYTVSELKERSARENALNAKKQELEDERAVLQDWKQRLEEWRHQEEQYFNDREKQLQGLINSVNACLSDCNALRQDFIDECQKMPEKAQEELTASFQEYLGHLEAHNVTLGKKKRDGTPYRVSFKDDFEQFHKRRMEQKVQPLDGKLQELEKRQLSHRRAVDPAMVDMAEKFYSQNPQVPGGYGLGD